MWIHDQLPEHSWRVNIRDFCDHPHSFPSTAFFWRTAKERTVCLARDLNSHSSPLEDTKASSHTRFVPARIGKNANELVSGRSDPKELAALETGEFQIVDRFCDWHDLIGLKARAHFWTDGFAMIRREEFFPQCMVQHVRLTPWNAGIAQLTVSYNRGIALEGGERIPPFSEIHTFLLARVESGWLVSAEDIVQQNYLESREYSPDLSSRPPSEQSGAKAASDDL